MLNEIQIIGNLGKDPEVRYTPGGSAVVSFSVATQEKWKDKNSGEMQEKTSWHRVTAFGRLAEICGEYLKKGSQVYVSGRMESGKYTDKAGVEKYTADIVAKEMKMLGGKPERNDAGNTAPHQSYDGNSKATGSTEPDGSVAQPDNFDDDIPF